MLSAVVVHFVRISQAMIGFRQAVRNHRTVESWPVGCVFYWLFGDPSVTTTQPLQE